jgi:hypothetical protein
MAGDWIKMRSDLFTHPKVVRMASALKADRLRVVGGLMSVWCLFDAHSADGKIEGYDFGTVDELLNWSGFAAAMSAVNWLAQDDESLVLPDFDKHNGQSAKRRAQDADRKREVRKASASDADNMRTREEKRREEDKSPPIPPKRGKGGDVIPYEEILAAFRELLPSLEAPMKVTDKRRRLIRKTWDYLPDAHRKIGAYKAIFAECADDPFYNGTGPYRDENANWRPTFDFIVREDQFVKVYERAMHRRAQRHQVNGHGAQPGLALQ